MADSNIDIVPQPRIDTIVVDAVTGGQRRHTEYTGTVWFAGRPNFGGATMVRMATIGTPFFLPDSLPYRPDPLNDAVIACTVALQGGEEGANQIAEYHAGLVADPRNPAVCWMQLQVVARVHAPCAVSYRIDAVVALNAILTDGG